MKRVNYFVLGCAFLGLSSLASAHEVYVLCSTDGVQATKNFSVWQGIVTECMDFSKNHPKDGSKLGAVAEQTCEGVLRHPAVQHSRIGAIETYVRYSKEDCEKDRAHALDIIGKRTQSTSKMNLHVKVKRQGGMKTGDLTVPTTLYRTR